MRIISVIMFVIACLFGQFVFEAWNLLSRPNENFTIQPFLNITPVIVAGIVFWLAYCKKYGINEQQLEDQKKLKTIVSNQGKSIDNDPNVVIRELSDENKRLASKLHKLTKEKSTLGIELQSLEGNLDEQKKKTREIQDELSRLKKSIKNTDIEAETFNRKIREEKAKTLEQIDRVNSLNKQLAQKNREIKKLNQEIITLTQQLREVVSGRDSLINDEREEGLKILSQQQSAMQELQRRMREMETVCHEQYQQLVSGFFVHINDYFEQESTELKVEKLLHMILWLDSLKKDETLGHFILLVQKTVNQFLEYHVLSFSFDFVKSYDEVFYQALLKFSHAYQDRTESVISQDEGFIADSTENFAKAQQRVIELIANHG